MRRSKPRHSIHSSIQSHQKRASLPHSSGHGPRPTRSTETPTTGNSRARHSSLGWHRRNSPSHSTNSPQATASDFVFLPAVNGSAPTVPGFTAQAIVGYAYSTQVCGSVPLFLLLMLVRLITGWTISQSDHNEVITSELGWIDAGIPFYVFTVGYVFVLSNTTVI